MLIFTLSYIKTLPNAFVLGDSIKNIHPEFEFVVGLVDDHTKIPSTLSSKYKIVPINELNISNFNNLQAKYNENELLPNCKPHFFKYFLNQSDTVVYFDCTSVIYSNFDFLVEAFIKNDILLTPQLLIANKHPKENNALNSGVFHSGFIGLKNTKNTFRFLEWWQSHTTQKGYIDLCKGMNADQYCLELTPTLFDNVIIIKHLGLNVGEWNLPEREITEHQGIKQIGQDKLISFNFRGLKFTKEYIGMLDKYNQDAVKNTAISHGIRTKKLSKISILLIKASKSVNTLIDKFFDKF